MTDQELKKIYTEICGNLASRRIKPVFDRLEKLISENGLGLYYDQYHNLEETYRFMLKYTVEGIRDPERQKVYRKLIVSVFELADQVYEAIRMRLSPAIEYEMKRTLRDKFIEDMAIYISHLEDYYLQEEKEIMPAKAEEEQLSSMRKLFYHIWFNNKLTSEEVESLRVFMLSPVISVPYKSFIVIALILSLQRFFDREKFILLFDAYDSTEVEVNQRAMAGLLINLYRYDKRMAFYPAITGRLKILNENPEFKRDIERVIVQLIRSKETEELQQRIRDEILPEMIRISPTLKDKINLDSLMEEGLSEDKNPDWQELFKDTPGLLDKMEEFSELQMEGADVFMGSFAMLKSFPFFSETGNWFIPFFPGNPEITEAVQDSEKSLTKLLEVIGKAPILCNSDKYSFCFSMQSLPEETREFMAQGIQSEMDQIRELEKDEELTRPGRKAGFVSNQFIQDLYRFYKLFPRKGDFDDIFNWRFDFHNTQALGEILKEDPAMLRNIAEYYFVRNHFGEAVEIFQFLLQSEKAGELYQKAAFCHQKMGNFPEALGLYLKAELFDINRLWNLRKIALCYRNMKQTDKALEYYQMAEKLDPDSLNNQLNIGHCLLELKKYSEALKCYFKVEYLSPGNKKVWRPIAWCSFLSGKREQAEKYLFQLIEDEPNKHDFMNMGHVQWSLGKRKPALDFYRKSISDQGFTNREFIEVFEEDMPHLLDQGIDAEDVPIMLDQLRYLLEE